VVINDSHIDLELYIKWKIALKLLISANMLLATMYPGHAEGKKENDAIFEKALKL